MPQYFSSCGRNAVELQQDVYSISTVNWNAVKLQHHCGTTANFGTEEVQENIQCCITEHYNGCSIASAVLKLQVFLD